MCLKTLSLLGFDLFLMAAKMPLDMFFRKVKTPYIHRFFLSEILWKQRLYKSESPSEIAKGSFIHRIFAANMDFFRRRAAALDPQDLLLL
jgi:hypothetical protein